MKTIIFVQSLSTPERMKKEIRKFSPELSEKVLYSTNFEVTLEMIPKEGEVVIITSDAFHEEDVHILNIDKDGYRLAELAKKVNSQVKVYIYSSYAPSKLDEDVNLIDGHFHKHKMGVEDEIPEIFYRLGLADRPMVDKSKKETEPPLFTFYVKVFFCILGVMIILGVVKIFIN